MWVNKIRIIPILQINEPTSETIMYVIIFANSVKSRE